MNLDTDEGRKAVATMLEATDARLHLMTGGDYLKRDALTGVWKDSVGNPVELYDGLRPDGNGVWRKVDLRAKIKALSEEKGEPPPKGLAKMNLAELKQTALEMNPATANISKVPSSNSYHVFQNGRVELRSMLAGKDADPMVLHRDGRVLAAQDFAVRSGIPEGDQLWVVMDVGEVDRTAGVIPAGSRVEKSPRDALRGHKPGETQLVLVDARTVSDEVYTELVEASTGGVTGKAVLAPSDELGRRLSDLPRNESTVVSVNGRAMTRSEFDGQLGLLEAKIEAELTPAAVKARNLENERLVAAGREPVDAVAELREELYALKDAWRDGRAVAGAGSSPVPTVAISDSLNDAARLSQASWEQLADDDWVIVYHHTSEDAAGAIVTGGVGPDTVPAGEAGLRVTF